MLPIQEFLHTAILVKDLAQSEYFYGQVLGLSKVERVFTYPGAWYQIGDYQIHLIVAPTWQAPTPNPEQWGRNPHLALRVTDLDKAIALLTEQGYPLQRSASGRKAVFLADPDGNIVELSA